MSTLPLIGKADRIWARFAPPPPSSAALFHRKTFLVQKNASARFHKEPLFKVPNLKAYTGRKVDALGAAWVG